MSVLNYFAVYDDSGRIIRSGYCSEPSDVMLQASSPDQNIVATATMPSWTTEYVSDGAVTPRPTFPATIDKTKITADDTDAATVSGLPDPCTVSVDGVDQTVTGGSLMITSPMAATYTLKASTWPYLDWEQTIEAVAQ